MNAPAAPYSVHIAVFSTGERMPFVLHSDTAQPVVLAMRYIIDVRRSHCQFSTLRRDALVLAAVFTWAGEVGIDLDTRLRVGPELTPAEILSIARYLRSGRHANVITTLPNAHSAIRPRSFNAYFGVVEDFAMWALTTLQSRAPSAVAANIAAAQHSTERAFAANRLSGGRARVRYGLSRDDFEFLCRVVHPDAEANPFRRAVRLRNYIIIRLLAETGLRRGELLKLRLKDVVTVGNSPQIKVVRSPDDPLDCRTEEPGVKTEERVIPITMDLCRLLVAYLQPNGGRGRARPGHPYFFTNSRTALPLTLNGVNRIFMQIIARFDRFGGDGVLTPHTLRRSFNDQLCETARAQGWEDKKIEDLQKYLNGWSPSSVQGAIYSRRFNEQSARELASQMQARLYAPEVAA